MPQEADASVKAREKIQGSLGPAPCVMPNENRSLSTILGEEVETQCAQVKANTTCTEGLSLLQS